MNGTSKLPWLINWLGYLAIALLVMLPLAVLTVRSGAWQQGLLMLALCCLGATALMVLAVILMLLPRYANWRGAILKRAAYALPGTVLLAVAIQGGGKYPPIHDITTAPDNPPVFVSAPEQRGEGSNSLDIDPEVIAQQRAAYADLQSLRSDLSIEAAFNRAGQVAISMGWEIYHQDKDLGIIEAVDTTTIMAFKDDIVMRVRSDEYGSFVDLRSVSRVGVSDMGANAARIRDFRERFETP